MNIPPLVEKLLLSNEAVFKNASLGISGENMVYIPPGKTAVILEVTIEPFCNVFSDSGPSLFEDGWIDQAYNLFKNRNNFQLQIINDAYSTYLTFNNAFTVTRPNINHQGLNLNYNHRKEDLFILTDRSLYFNIIYPFFEPDEAAPFTGLTIYSDSPANCFLAKIQNLPNYTVSFNNSPFLLQTYRVTVGAPSTLSDQYYPVNQQINPAFEPEYKQQEYLRYRFGTFQEQGVIPPVPTNTELPYYGLFLVPFINVKYALLNKRPDDYGITMPTLK
jgi:hypothetical protein